jgi:uncharacterized phage-associated protein
MDSKRIAKFIVNYFELDGNPITNLKLQKLLYYIQVWYMVYFDKKFLFDEKPQAWVHGPVYPNVYNEYKAFRGDIIKCNDPNLNVLVESEKKAIFSTSLENEFIDEILKEYGHKNGFTLEMMTHNEDPWQVARSGFAPLEKCDKVINLDFACTYYHKLLEY